VRDLHRLLVGASRSERHRRVYSSMRPYSKVERATGGQLGLLSVPYATHPRASLLRHGWILRSNYWGWSSQLALGSCTATSAHEAGKAHFGVRSVEADVIGNEVDARRLVH
jgi:hypothetical protein